jgi:hypothetical protein
MQEIAAPHIAMRSRPPLGDLRRLVARLFLLICQAVKLTQNPAPRALLAFRPSGNRSTDPHSSAGSDNGEWHDQSSNRYSTWFASRLFEAG